MNDFNARGHLIFGLATGLFVINTPGDMLFILLGSLLPDIDHPNSTLGKYFILNRIKLRKARGKIPNTYAHKKKREPLFIHRGKCHTIIGVLLLCIPMLLLGGYLSFIYVLYGAVGHLVADRLYSMFPKKRKFTLKLW